MLDTDDDVHLVEGEVRVTGLYVVASGRMFLIRRMRVAPELDIEAVSLWRRGLAFVLCGAMAGATVAVSGVLLRYDLPLPWLLVIAALWAAVGVVLDRRVFAPRFTVRVYHDERWHPLLVTRDGARARRVLDAILTARRKSVPSA